jgi:hypothetical protein
MGFYSKYVLPRLIDLAMKNRDTARLRAEWLSHARGDVLEVGIGSGLNLPFYSSEVRRVCGVDPSVELQRIARSRLPAGSKSSSSCSLLKIRCRHPMQVSIPWL